MANNNNTSIDEIVKILEAQHQTQCTDTACVDTCYYWTCPACGEERRNDEVLLTEGICSLCQEH